MMSNFVFAPELLGSRRLKSHLTKNSIGAKHGSGFEF
jgi:hypothetical protein